MKKTLLCAMVTVSLAAAMMTGCGSGDGEAGSEAGQVTLQFMNHTGEDRTIKYEDELIAEFEAANPDIKIEVQRMSMDDYTQTIQTKFASDDAPDVFVIEQSNLELYAKNDYLLDLSDTDIVNHYDGNMLAYDGKMYGAPLGVNAYVVTYNKSIFDKVGVEVPETLDEFYAACDAIQAAGYTPLAAGYQDSWVLMADTQAEYVTSIMKDDLDALKKLESREVRFADSADWRAVFERFGRRLAYTQGDQFGTDWNTACTMLANAEAAMVISSGKARALSAEADFNFKEEYRAAFQNVVSQFVLDGGTDVDKVLADLDSEFDRIAGN